MCIKVLSGGGGGGGGDPITDFISFFLNIP